MNVARFGVRKRQKLAKGLQSKKCLGTVKYPPTPRDTSEGQGLVVKEITFSLVVRNP